MAVEYRIDLSRQLVVMRASGLLLSEEVFAYQRGVWASPELASFDELVDLSHVEVFGPVSGERIDELASLSASMEKPGTRARCAVVAPEDLGYGLARMYEAYHRLRTRGTRDVAVFRTLADAADWPGHPRVVTESSDALFAKARHT